VLERLEPPDPRWLSGVVAVTKEVSTYLGLREGVDTVARVEIPDSTRQALAPMSPEAYMSLLTSSNGMAGVTAVPPRIEDQAPIDLEPINVVEAGATPAEPPPPPSSVGGSDQVRVLRRES
jgi:hypothetical protein